ncbi:hypothetical protein HDF16_000149 [Granulicella aggregans]|uniref:Uncharacterized protein n=1 Tax=Granulicella aggregans TaxID=474949 RepID=A0A7W7Z8X4_9BACT|nr:hypothetical protein [Granulicella aggregans]
MPRKSMKWEPGPLPIEPIPSFGGDRFDRKRVSRTELPGQQTFGSLLTCASFQS